MLKEAYDIVASKMSNMEVINNSKKKQQQQQL